MEVKVEKDLAIVKCRYEEKELVKAIGDYKFDKPTSTWRFPLRKLVEIIDNLNVQYDSDTEKIYEILRSDRQKFHALINHANKIKNNNTSIEMYPECYHHQKKAISLGTMFDSYAFFMETGTGKSLVAVKLIKYLKVPTLIIAPLSTLESVWVKEIKKWSNLDSVILWHHLEKFEEDHDVYLINYESFKTLSAKKKIEEKIQCIVIDESSKLKNPKSQITKEVLKYKDKVKHRFCLTGTPAPNNLLEYWGQMAFINSSLLGENFYKFRNTYFFSCGYGGYLYKPNAGAKEAIMDNVSKQAFSVKKIDCVDLPDRVYETRYIYMDEVQAKAYDMMKKENIMEFKEHITLSANELAKIMKLRQVTSGFTITTEGIPVLISNTKIQALKDLLEEIPEDEQVIIWINFHWELHKLKEEIGDSATVLYGEIPQKEKDQNIKDFQEGKKRVLIAHPLSGGFGLNLMNCSYIIWFSLSYSSEQHSQANDRIYRIGQKNKCTYFYLLAKDTIDEAIYNVLNKKISLIESCLEILKKGK